MSNQTKAITSEKELEALYRKFPEINQLTTLCKVVSCQWHPETDECDVYVIADFLWILFLWKCAFSLQRKMAGAKRYWTT
jgi:hypothetical protein